MVEPDAVEWAERVFGGCELGDGRRTARLVDLSAHLAKAGGGTIATACGDDLAAAEGGYRFVRSKHVDTADIAEGGFAATVEMARTLEVMVAIQDTTSVSYSHSVAKELGDLGGPKDRQGRGWFVHSTLLVDGLTQGTVGLIDQKRWRRPPGTRGKRQKRKETPYEEKESFKWQASSERVRARLGAATMARVIEVCDREADIYEYLTYKLERGERFVVRSSWDRGVESESGRLWATVKEETPLGVYEVLVPQRGAQKASRNQKARKARKARTAQVTLRAAQVKFKPPLRPGRELPAVDLWVVNVFEEEPPKDDEAIEWTLLTTETTDSFEAAHCVVGWYELRWRVEEFHKAWKTGCRVEEERLQTPENLERLTVILAFVAVRLLQLRELAQAEPEQPCTRVLSEVAWKCLWLALNKKKHAKPPEEPPTLAWAYAAIARYGGWQNTKRTGRAGWATVWKGWSRLANTLEGFELAFRIMGKKCD